jgi:hypothetical protein
MAEKPKPKLGRPLFTNIDRSKCTRVVPLEVMVLGLPKTGTSCKRSRLFDTSIEYHSITSARHKSTHILYSQPHHHFLHSPVLNRCFRQVSSPSTSQAPINSIVIVIPFMTLPPPLISSILAPAIYSSPPILSHTLQHPF